MSARIDVFISSTSLDLPAHRKQALDACLRMGVFPVMMEHLPSSSAGAIAASLRMVDEAEIYIGIYAHRYGYIPDGYEISITEMEYNHAVERGIPRLIFIIGDDHSPTDIETGPSAQKLNTFKQRVTTENIVNFFSSPEDLRGQIIQSLVPYREIEKDELHSRQARNIPMPPTPYIAHPYTLLQTSRLIGRQKELQLLNNWVSNSSSDVYKAAIMNVVAIGGMGKSALTWTWFTDIMPHLMDPLAGRLWWSFYESDARFENFVTRGLAYVTGLPVEQIENTMHPGEREDMLLQQLDSRPFLFVLDGLERILVAYSRMDAAYLADDELDVQTANHVADALGLPANASHSFTGQHRSRKTTNPRAGNFLRKLATVRASKILVSTRLFPADLQTSTGHATPGTFAYFLTGLSDDDAVQLWREFGVSGSRDNLLPVFNAFENYPLLIRALAGEVARFRRAPGDFDRWLDNNPDFNPLDLSLANVKSHVLHYALQGIKPEQLKVLQTIAGFRMPATYDTLAALLVGNHFSSEDQLDIALTELEDRGLVGWDKLANRYDLHPIVRGVVWSGLGHDERQDIHESLYDHFNSLPRANTQYFEVDSLDELTAANELYHALIGLGKYDMAFEIFRTRLSRPLLYRLGANQELVRLLEMLFPGGIETRPPLGSVTTQAFAIGALARAYFYSGKLDIATELYRTNLSIVGGQKESYRTYRRKYIVLEKYVEALTYGGYLYEADEAARAGLLLTLKQDDDIWLAGTLVKMGYLYQMRGLMPLTQKMLQKAIEIFEAVNRPTLEGIAHSYLGQWALEAGDYETALQEARLAYDLAEILRNEDHYLRAMRIQGVAYLYLDDVSQAEKLVNEALQRVRHISYVEEEIPIALALVDIALSQQQWQRAREAIDDIRETIERGPFPLFQADLLNRLAYLEHETGNDAAAQLAAAYAYELAWCDGGDYVYRQGLDTARQLLEAMGSSPPKLSTSTTETLSDIDWDAIFDRQVDWVDR